MMAKLNQTALAHIKHAIETLQRETEEANNANSPSINDDVQIEELVRKHTHTLQKLPFVNLSIGRKSTLLN